MYDTVFTERLGRPAAVLVNEGFGFDARSAASGKGMPGVRVVAETVPCECTMPGRITSGVRAAIDDVVAALTRPLSQEERSPATRRADPTDGVVFKGDLQEVQRFYYRRGWTDGLPVIPPTEAAVQEMLAGTELPADHLVGRMIPRLGRVTVRKIAVNAVMAGALPTYLPLLVAGVEALLDPRAAFGTWEVSTGSWAPFWIVNGPIREQLHVESGTGALSPGSIANATIGRAMGLIVKNLGGARKGLEDMGVLGNPGKYSMVIAENEEANPAGWEPLHVQQGFRRDESCLTVSFPNTYLQIWPYGSDDKGIMRAIGANMVPRWRQLTLLVPPGHAQALADGGWTKEEIASYLYEHARVPAYRTPEFWGVPSIVHRGSRPPLNAEDSVPMLRRPDSLRVVVAGGPGTFMGLAYGSSGWVTKPVCLPARWESLVRTYRGLVPDYLRY
ncbi:MAG TPA: hypothetical protein VKF59_08355 [Candidatus Dormibacteraeota bacterium]|nr:hypothetical protein [Candidatus Dormibacteraeota bacterium]